jgi:RNA polymerase sigma factor FliA
MTAPASATTVLISEHIPLVHQHVQELPDASSQSVEWDELVSTGLLALVCAARTFDPTGRAPFDQYASARIRGALMNEVRAVEGPSRTARRRLNLMRTGHTELVAALGRPPTMIELGLFVGLSPKQMATAVQIARCGNPVHLQDIGLDTVANLLPDSEPGPEEHVLRREFADKLWDGINALPRSMRTVVVEYFVCERPMARIAVDLGVTPSRISQLRGQAVDRLRRRLALLVES